jgi:hypothetical protein
VVRHAVGGAQEVIITSLISMQPLLIGRLINQIELVSEILEQ